MNNIGNMFTPSSAEDDARRLALIVEALDQDTHSPESFRELLATEDAYVLTAIAFNPHADASTLHAIFKLSLNIYADEERPMVQKAVALHPNTDMETLHHLVQHPECHWETAFFVASNLNAGSSTLRQLAQHQNEVVRASVMIHPATPYVCSATALHDESEVVQMAAMMNSLLSDQRKTSLAVHSLVQMSEISLHEFLMDVDYLFTPNNEEAFGEDLAA